MAQERTVYNALHAYPMYEYKYGRGSAFFELKHNFRLTDKEILWVINHLLKKGEIGEWDKELALRELHIDEKEVNLEERMINSAKSFKSLKEGESEDDWYFDWGTEEAQGSDIFDKNRGESSYAREMIKLAKTGGTNEKGLGAQIVEMTPREYLEACAKGFNSTYSNQIAQIEYDKTTLSRLQQVLTKYKKKFPITYLNVGSGWDRQEVHRGEFEQEGRHRMYVAGKMFGWDTKFPVLQIYEKDSEKADRYWKRRAEEKLQSVLWTAIQKAQRYHYLDVPELKEQMEWYLDNHFDGKSYSFSVEDVGNDQLLFTLNGVNSKHYKDEFSFDRVPSVSEDDFDDLSDEEMAQLEKELGFKI